MAQRGNLLRPLIRFAPNFSGSGQTAFGPFSDFQIVIEWATAFRNASSPLLCLQ